MYQVYCEVTGCAKSVMAAEYRSLSDAQAAADSIREKIRLAKSLGDLGDSYLRKCTHVFLKDDESDLRLEYSLDDENIPEEIDAAEPQN